MYLYDTLVSLSVQRLSQCICTVHESVDLYRLITNCPGIVCWPVFACNRTYCEHVWVVLCVLKCNTVAVVQSTPEEGCNLFLISALCQQVPIGRGHY